jgi:hypothetical protein
MSVHDLGKDRAEVGGDGEVSSFVALLRRESRPSAVDLSSAYRSADDHHRVAMPVIGSAVPVLHDRASELGHRQNHYVLHAIAEVAHERGQTASQIVEQIKKAK